VIKPEKKRKSSAPEGKNPSKKVETVVTMETEKNPKQLFEEKLKKHRHLGRKVKEIEELEENLRKVKSQFFGRL
jgi:hypothetical protein